MSRALFVALFASGIAGLFLLLLRPLAPAWWTLTGVSVLLHTAILFFATHAAQKSPLRIFALTGSVWLLLGTSGVLLFLNSAGAHVLLVLVTVLLLWLFDYHIIRFITLPAARPRIIVLFTSRLLSAYAVYLVAAALLGFVTRIHFNAPLALFVIVLAVASILAPWVWFVEKKTEQRLLSLFVPLLFVTEVIWASMLLPIASIISASFAAIGFFVALRLILKEANELPRDKSRAVVYAAVAVFVILAVVLGFAQWV